MKEINGNFKTTFIFSTHDKRVMAMANRLVRIEDGQIAGEDVKEDEKVAMAVDRRSAIDDSLASGTGQSKADETTT